MTVVVLDKNVKDQMPSWKFQKDAKWNMLGGICGLQKDY